MSVEQDRWYEGEIRFEASNFHFWHFARKEVPLAKFLWLHVWHFVIKFDLRLGAISTRKKKEKCAREEYVKVALSSKGCSSVVFVNVEDWNPQYHNIL